MEVEDEILSEIEDRDTTIMMKDKELEKKKKKNQELNEKNQELNEKMLLIKDMAKMLYEQGVPPEVIAERFNLDAGLLKNILK